MALFNYCLVADDVRIEAQGNKATIIGFLGILPHTEIAVPQPNLPIVKTTFLLLTGRPILAGHYGVRLSVKDPRGNELLDQQTDIVTGDLQGGPWNVVIACQPLPLAGVGTYRFAAIVNGAEDFVSEFRIAQMPSPQ